MFVLVQRKRLLGSILLLILIALGLFLVARRPMSKDPQPPGSLEDNNNIKGEYLSWNDAKSIFPKYAQATIIDYETGQQFKVQRRAGSFHADVQPLSALDTKTMKAIYGQWSWRRRAVVVVLNDGRKIAASMNGMPHGAGAIQNNNFNGHFCLHFRDSRTHASGRPDLAHQVMIWKAAGQFEQQMQSQPPEDVIKIFITILNQGDRGLADRMVYGPPDSPGMTSQLKIQSIRIVGMEALGPASFKVDLQASFQGSSKLSRKKTQLDLVQGPPYWRIQAASLHDLWEPNTWSPSQAAVIFDDEEDAEMPVNGL
ncbi:MAG TPA: hypothetical protein VN426_12855 [Syntrophomonadaceae bacterium]|nr:hypothetical protein [Syntrophomonadaceae bacterium]